MRNILILGGYGTFGRPIAEQLCGQPDSQVTIAGRSPDRGRPLADSLGVRFRQCDATNRESLRRAIDDAWLVINAAGPFLATDYTIPRACLESGCHYIDLSDGRDYVGSISQLDRAARAHNVFVCVGASATPAVTSALVADLLPGLGEVDSIKVALNPGNRNRAGASTIATILGYVARPVPVWQAGEWRTLRGWSRGEFVEFPPPVGRRRVQLCDVPDLALFPEHFGARNVIFKAGVELPILNYAVALLGCLKRVCPPLHLPALARPLVAASTLFKLFGTLRGGCAVWVTDIDGRQKSAAVVAHENGPRIPGSPAVLLARKLLAGEITRVGASACLGFLELAEFAEFLAPFHIEVVHGEDGNWNPPHEQ